MSAQFADGMIAKASVLIRTDDFQGFILDVA